MNNKRVFPGESVQDPSSIANLTYNNAAGAQKNAEVGRHLKPLQTGAATWSTNATTAVILPSKGRNLAVYNNAAAVGSVTLGSELYPPTSQAAGAVQASTEGQNVGIPCAPNDWTYIACGEQDRVIASAATLLVFLIDDDTLIRQQTTR